MDLTFEINNKISYLDDDKKRLILEIINNFLPDDEDVKTDDLHYLDLAEQELARGETISHNNIKWK